ncbi:metallophosphoesterase [uncultured Clostridium sp.]|uniref:metallophosphoesterase n=1 Tax=uncultured Clostridium sp. TaxID=59620 RepID=UPI0026377965|nr:metallophosphoesterase [uncultured Clostridium sp.]
MDYVVSDIHGNFNALKRLLKHVKFTEKDTLIINGDILDRGSQILDVIKFVFLVPNVELIMGNHELMFINAYETGLLTKFFDDSYNYESEIIDLWLLNGGMETIKVLVKYSIEDGENKFEKLYNFLKERPYYIARGENIITHAGPSNELKSFRKNEIIENLCSLEKSDLVWDRYFNLNAIRFDFCKLDNLDCNIIIGHTTIKNFNVSPIRVIGENYIANINYTFGDHMAILNLDKKVLYCIGNNLEIIEKTI